MHPIPRVAVVLPMLALFACNDSAAPSVLDLQESRARWAHLHLTTYVYDFGMTGFFNNMSGHVFHVTVREDTVRSAVDLATGDSLPLLQAGVPTIDALFEQAIAARNSGTLSDIQFDPIMRYPHVISLMGPPDASGSLAASHLQPLP
ncbi:MAG: DUF6174 domain-containing protein [Gemmatimonadota bacterium]